MEELAKALTNLGNVLNELKLWITDFGGQWAQLKGEMLVSLDATTDTFTLFAIAFFIMARVMGFDTGNKWIGLIITIWVFIKFFLAVNGVL